MVGVYVEHVVEFENDPLESVARLASRLGTDAYFLYENSGTWSFASGVLAELWLDGEGIHLRSPESRRDLGWGADPLARVSSLLDELPYQGWRAYGWTAFELSYAIGGDLSTVGPERLLHVVIPRTEVHLTATGARIRSVDGAEARRVEQTLRDRSLPQRLGTRVAVDVRAQNGVDYQAAVAHAVADIQSKVLDKVVLSRCVPVPAELDFVETYIAGRRANNPARSFLMSLGGLDALGYSPEIIVKVDAAGMVTSQPLAGTRALSADPAESARLRAELLADPKEVFEHAISVKTVYDELAVVCEPDSLSVGEFMHVQERGTVQHLASLVTGRLGAGRRAWDAFAAVFPTATVSGVPKAAANAYIRKHEPERRGLYGAAVFMTDQEGTLDAALVLRAVYRQDGRTWLRAGGGVVAGSKPAREFEETCEKLDSVAGYLVPRTA